MGLILPYIVPVLIGIGALLVFVALYKALGIRVIPNDRVAVVEKWWSPKGSLKGGIIALNGEAGYEPDNLRGGVHIRPGLMYKVTQYPPVTIPEGQIGYIYARSGEPVTNDQTLAKAMPIEAFLDVRKFLSEGGQQGPQRTILRQGTHMINLAQFVVITKNRTYYHPVGDKESMRDITDMAEKIRDRGGFEPVVISNEEDKCGIVTVHDGPSLESDDTGQHIICPVVGTDPSDPATYHNNFQDPEKFLAAGGYRGRQLQVISEGTWWINRLFADVELIEKTIIPVGYCGVVVSYVGDPGKDVSGDEFLHGELVENGERGVWKTSFLPGKYAINTYAYNVVQVPTTNVILKWKTEESGEHKFDVGLTEVGIITKDAFEPNLPLSVVVHIDYKKAPHVIQRFGDVKRLVEQTLDPMVSAYFKNIGQTKTLIELLQQRGEIQIQATKEMKEKFGHYNLELEEVLMDTPRGAENDNKIETILTQLRDRQIAVEKLETFTKQQTAAEKEKDLKEAQAVAEQQTVLTESNIQIEIMSNKGAAELAQARQKAEQIKVQANADAEKIRVTAQAEADQTRMMGEAEADKTARTGVAAGIAIEEQVNAYGGAQYKLFETIIPKVAEAFGSGNIPLVPETVITMGGGDGQMPNTLELLFALMASEKLGIDLANPETGSRDRSAEATRLREQLTTGMSVVAPEKPADPVVVPEESVAGSDAEASETTATSEPATEEAPSQGPEQSGRKPRSKKNQS